MPTNRRYRARGWRPRLDPYRWASLAHGPESVVLAGAGYYRLPPRAANEAEHAAVREAMEADWQAHGAQVTAWWVEAVPRVGDLPFARLEPGGPGSRPWGWWQFEAPEPRRQRESETAYLDRLGVLADDERRRLGVRK